MRFATRKLPLSYEIKVSSSIQSKHAFLAISGMAAAIVLAACGNLVYVPDRATIKNIPLDAAVLDASDAIGQASLLYQKQHLTSNTTQVFVKLIGFKIGADGKKATAIYVLDGQTQSCTEASDWWLGSGPHTGGIYLAGTMPFPDSKSIGGSYCMTQNLIFSDCDFRFMCWTDENSAKRFVDAMTVVSAEAGPGFAQALLNSELLPNNYPADLSSTKSSADALSGAIQYATQARSAVSAGRANDGITLYQKAVSLAPAWPAGHYNLAMLFATEGRYADAVNEMNTYLALLPSAPNVAAVEKLVVQWQSAESAGQR